MDLLWQNKVGMLYHLLYHTSSIPSRIDSGGVIKVADFGLCEDIYSRNYFRQGCGDAAVRLPIRWMALESLQDGIFSEKTDVVSRNLLVPWLFFTVLYHDFSPSFLVLLFPPPYLSSSSPSPSQHTHSGHLV